MAVLAGAKLNGQSPILWYCLPGVGWCATRSACSLHSPFSIPPDRHMHVNIIKWNIALCLFYIILYLIFLLTSQIIEMLDFSKCVFHTIIPSLYDLATACLPIFNVDFPLCNPFICSIILCCCFSFLSKWMREYQI